MWPPPLLRDRPPVVQLILVSVLPVVFGAICGVLLSRSAAAYSILTLLGVVGGVSAGFEHVGVREGLARGAAGGVLFALAIVIVHEIGGRPAEADLPASLGVMAVIYALLGTAFGALGGWLRERRERGGRGGSDDRAERGTPDPA